MKKVIVSGESRKGDVVIEMNGLNEIINIQIDDELLAPDRKRDLVEGLKRAMEQARKAQQREMANDFDMSDIQGILGR